MAPGLASLFGVSNPFDPSNRYTTSWIIPPIFLAALRLLLSVYIFTTIFFTFGWDGAHHRLYLVRRSFSYFTDLGYWGLAFYFCFSFLHTLSYARNGKSWLQRWPVPLQAAHGVFYTTVVTFPILVTAVFWAVLYSGHWYHAIFDGWSNISKHALNTVFAIFEITIPRTFPPPWIHLPILIILLALYLGLAYLTHATEGFYPYDFLDPRKGSGKLVGYVFGILAAIVVIFLIVYFIIWIRLTLTEKTLGKQGKFAKSTRRPGDEEEEMTEMTREEMK